mmetsp:Transcript_71353/g.231888  ORF Transcript_71353/g.231888 Transcript_71353/m.231888 type:complete len:419 (+) Transcript_71353:108-1364(+)
MAVAARWSLLLVACLSSVVVLVAGSWTKPRSYDAQRVERPIEVDGDIYTAEWQAVPWSDDFVDIQGEDAPVANRPTAKTRTRMKMRWDDEFLYIAAEMSAHDWPIIAKQTRRNSVIYSTDSDFEVFLDTDESNYNYKEFEVNAKNIVWNLLLDKPYSDGGGEHSARVAKPGEPNYWEVHKQKTGAKLYGVIGQPTPEGRWIVEIAMAHSDSMDRTATVKPAVGKFWRINFSRVEKKGNLNWVWSPQMLWSPSKHRPEGTVAMHYPDVWGYVHFIEAAPGAPASSWADPQWPLKAAASQLFLAEDQAVKEAGSAVKLDVLATKNWIDSESLLKFQPVLTISGPKTDWSAQLHDADGCTASIGGAHKLEVRCPVTLRGSVGWFLAEHLWSFLLLLIAAVAVGFFVGWRMFHQGCVAKFSA